MYAAKQYRPEPETVRRSAVAQRTEDKNRSVAGTIQRKPNRTGLPDHLKSGIESLSGHSMDDVKVHYNSDKPAQLRAHAYAQGTDIHLGPGQEKHLPHEAWHVVQQKEGRVKQTKQLRNILDIGNTITQLYSIYVASNAEDILNLIQDENRVYHQKPMVISVSIDGRPSIAEETKRRVIAKTGMNKQPGDELRHITSFEDISTYLESNLHGKSLQEASDWLKDTFEHTDIPSPYHFVNNLEGFVCDTFGQLSTLAEAWLWSRQNDPENLFYGKGSDQPKDKTSHDDPMMANSDKDWGIFDGATFKNMAKQAAQDDVTKKRIAKAKNLRELKGSGLLDLVGRKLYRTPKDTEDLKLAIQSEKEKAKERMVNNSLHGRLAKNKFKRKKMAQYALGRSNAIKKGYLGKDYNKVKKEGNSILARGYNRGLEAGILHNMRRVRNNV